MPKKLVRAKKTLTRRTKKYSKSLKKKIDVWDKGRAKAIKDGTGVGSGKPYRRAGVKVVRRKKKMLNARDKVRALTPKPAPRKTYRSKLSTRSKKK